VRVVLGVEHHDSNSGSSSEESSSSNDDTESPAWQQGLNRDGSLLISVGEVVVSGGHEVEGSSSVHSNNSSVEVSISSVQLSAISGVLISVGSSSSDGRSGHAVGLVEVGHSESQGFRFEQDLSWVLADPFVGNGVRGPWIGDLDTVRSVSSVSSFSGISGGIGITSSPLEVDVISDSGVQVGWDKVVFGGGVGLDDVSSLSSNVQVEDSGKSWDSLGSLGDFEDVRSVLEGSSELSGILGKGEFGSSYSFIDDGIFHNNGLFIVVGPVDESTDGVGHLIESVFSSGDVISDSENAVASSFGFSAVFLVRNSPVVVV